MASNNESSSPKSQPHLPQHQAQGTGVENKFNSTTKATQQPQSITHKKATAADSSPIAEHTNPSHAQVSNPSTSEEQQQGGQSHKEHQKASQARKVQASLASTTRHSTVKMVDELGIEAIASLINAPIDRIASSTRV
ncbi:uncharacterized protein KY384_003982 [Bacidia gigantensis]|uniref:uncharacterized protein n=1 Tax=Bacidia gigantensis TaxID=2732470 RepID=UPI001D049169|nr:uncharacterized protein KY384_003982 [Bacidia gigantensis]KAG8532341.1 hypothetical protein KY384_003982 [Bacidia gigantensis]